VRFYGEGDGQDARGDGGRGCGGVRGHAAARAAASHAGATGALMCVCMAGRSDRSFLRSSFQGGSRQIRAAGHPLPRSRAAPLGVDRLKAFHCAVVIHQDATMLERPVTRLFRSTLVSFKASRNRTSSCHSRGIQQPATAPSCVCGLLCPMLSSVFKLPCCSRRVSQSWRGVERYWSDSSNRSSSSPSRGIERPHRASTDCSALCCRH
jgi:hypothetical protein